ncbi:MAG TPA: hypothetical protein VK939_08385 [Longimicrobiales bacterium]|nr:hypothetical protein [Longimicrobiales bacterium]
MDKVTKTLMAAAFAFLAAGTPLGAQQTDTAELNRLRRQIEALAAEIESMKLGTEVVAQADTAMLGMGPAATKVYRIRQGVSLGGYGEVLYENFAKEREDDTASNLRDQVDALRAILYVGYKFSDKWLFNSEIEFEHASTGQGGEVSVEFAYVDFVPSPYLGVRAGMVLVPMGFVNELHEPTTFLGSTRPVTENAIIPTTWRENGAGIFGEAAGLSWRAYVINGLDAVGGGPSRASGFGAGGIRGGRQKGARALIEDPAVVARLDFQPGPIPGLLVGGSGYRGNSGQGAVAATGESVDVATTILEGHAQFRAYGVDLRGLYARATLDDVTELNALRSLAGNASVGEELTGWYVQGGFDVLRFFDTAQQLTPYVRYERVNTQVSVPDGFAINPATERTITVVGAQWQPITNIVLKGDYQLHSNEANTGVNQFNVSLGYIF